MAAPGGSAQCAAGCGFGPVQHFAYGNLEAHQGQSVDRLAIKNECPHCGYKFKTAEGRTPCQGPLALSPQPSDRMDNLLFIIA